MNTLEYLDAAKAKLNLTSDYGLAKALGVTKETVSQLRRRRMHMSEGIALKVAAILEIDPVEVFISCSAERAQLPEAEAVWKGLLEKISHSFEVLISGATPGRRPFSAC